MRLIATLLLCSLLTSVHGQWRILNTNVDTTLTSIFFRTASHGIAVGHRTIIQTEDGGETWTVHDMGNLKFTFAFLIDSLGFTTTDEGLVYKSSDYGRSWQLNSIESDMRFRALHFFNPDLGFTGGSGGKIFRTVDSGENWSPIQIPTGRWIRDFHFFNENDGLAVADAGTTWYTTNGGLSWSFRASGIFEVLYDIHFVNDNLGFISAQGGFVLKTINGGQNWSIKSTPIASSLHYIDFADEERGITVGDDGLIFITEDGGENWTQVTSGFTENLGSVDVIDDVIYICGDNGLVIKGGPIDQLGLSRDIPIDELKIYLEGAYDSTTGLMRDNLRATALPLEEPYTDLGYTHVGGGAESTQQSVFDISGQDAIVDWVFLELRDKTNPSVVKATRSALLQRDGDVVDVDGVSPVVFFNMPSDAYHLVVKHRNHLGVMSAMPLNLSSTPTEINFTNSLDYTYGGANGIATLKNGKLGLYSGDFNRNGQVQNTDYNGMVLTLGISGYLSGDMDLNGQVQNTDLQLKLVLNIGKGIAFP